MTSRGFCYWLQGYLEIAAAGATTEFTDPLTPPQVRCIKSHLAMVFRHEIDPSFGGASHQKRLSELHEGTAPAPPAAPGPVGPTEPNARPHSYAWEPGLPKLMC